MKHVVCPVCGHEHECTRMGTQERARRAAAARWAKAEEIFYEAAHPLSENPYQGIPLIARWEPVGYAIEAEVNPEARPRPDDICLHRRKYRDCQFGMCVAMVAK